jgi:hypothetical protein
MHFEYSTETSQPAIGGDDANSRLLWRKLNHTGMFKCSPRVPRNAWVETSRAHEGDAETTFWFEEIERQGSTNSNRTVILFDHTRNIRVKLTPNAYYFSSSQDWSLLGNGIWSFEHVNSSIASESEVHFTPQISIMSEGNDILEIHGDAALVLVEVQGSDGTVMHFEELTDGLKFMTINASDVMRQYGISFKAGSVIGKLRVMDAHGVWSNLVELKAPTS